jgi:dipeptidyl aminopeptidase/acylaminoacyl peptidase
VPVEVHERESINQRPVLVASEKKSSVERVFWDPNPSMSQLQLGTAEVIKWKDDSGYEWEAGLLKPPGYVPGRRYPLVIQTHGFDKTQFLSNGRFSSAFAGRALAAHGFVVLQMGWNEHNFGSGEEAPNQLRGFESAVKNLADKGLIDPTRVGAIGFSRTVYHVLFAMTAAKSLFAATSVTDGVNYGYLEHMFSVDSREDANKINSGDPLRSEGMRNWLVRSPEFNLAGVQTPLLLLQPGLEAVFEDWEPYAALRYLKKPVDLIMLQPGTHVMTNPTQRLASEITNVDWFRFWLQGYEDPDPAKREQYVRWENLCKLQRVQSPRRKNVCISH